jgi:hypothetical protein
MKEFEYGKEKRDMILNVYVHRKGYLWWKRGEYEIKMYPVTADRYVRLEPTTKCHPLYNYCDNIVGLDRASIYILRQCGAKLRSKITTGKKLEYDNDPYIFIKHEFEFSSKWGKKKTNEAIDYFIDSVIKWK